MAARFAIWLVLAASVAWAGSARQALVALRAKLAASRLLDRQPGWNKLTRFAEQHAAEPALAAEVLYEVAVAQRRQGRRYAGRGLQKLLDDHPSQQPWAAMATVELADIYAGHSATRDKAIALYEKFLKLDGQPPGRRGQALFGLAGAYRGADRHAEAMACYRQFLDAFPTHLRRCAEALAAVGSLHVRLKQPQDAYQAYRKLAADYPWEIERRADLLLSIAGAYRTAADHEGARAAYERLLKDLPPAAAASASRRAQAYNGLAAIHLQQQNTEGAIAVYRRMAADTGLEATRRVQAYTQLFTHFRNATDHEAAIELGHELIAAHPTHVLSSGQLLEALVDAFVNEGRIEDALGMAKVYYRLSQLQVSGGSSVGTLAILAVVRALKAREGGLRSANAFLTFVAHGPEGPDEQAGTADDVKDPLAAYRLPEDAGRDRLFADAARRLASDPLELGYLYTCWDKPAEALRAFRRDYLAARTPAKLQLAASRLARAMRAFGAPEAEVDAFFDFQNLGPDGEDGKPNTADDLKDPILQRK